MMVSMVVSMVVLRVGTRVVLNQTTKVWAGGARGKMTVRPAKIYQPDPSSITNAKLVAVVMSLAKPQHPPIYEIDVVVRRRPITLFLPVVLPVVIVVVVAVNYFRRSPTLLRLFLGALAYPLPELSPKIYLLLQYSN